MSTPITPGTGAASVAAEAVGGLQYQQVEIYGGGGASVLSVNPDGSFKASVIGIPTVLVYGVPSISGTVNIGNAPSVYGNMSGSVVAFQGASWTTSVVGGPVTLYAPVTSFVSAVTSVITGTSSVTVLVGAPGGQRNYITHILATNAAAAGTFVNIYDGGNIVYSGYAASSGGGFSATLPVPLRQASAQGALCVATPTQASVVVAVSGYTAP